jgi:ferrous-iron efflux pump FieF
MTSERLTNLAAVASVAVAVVLIFAKTGAWLVTDSVSLLSTLVDSLLDAAASLINLFAIRHAMAPPDREHRFGHGKAEPLAALGQGAFITGSAVFLVFEAGQRLVSPRPVEQVGVGIIVMAVSLILTTGLVTFQRYVIKRTQSVAIKADSLHYIGDLLVNGAVLIALAIGPFVDMPRLDPILAIAIAVFILRSAFQIGRLSLDMLMDREFPDEDRARIVAIAREHPEVHALHDLRTRAAGPRSFIQLHLEMNGQMELWRAHEIADQVENELLKAFPNSEVIIHQDPYGLELEQDQSSMKL